MALIDDTQASARSQQEWSCWLHLALGAHPGRAGTIPWTGICPPRPACPVGGGRLCSGEEHWGTGPKFLVHEGLVFAKGPLLPSCTAAGSKVCIDFISHTVSHWAPHRAGGQSPECSRLHPLASWTVAACTPAGDWERGCWNDGGCGSRNNTAPTPQPPWPQVPL